MSNVDNDIEQILRFYALNAHYKSWSALDEAKQRLTTLLEQSERKARIDEMQIANKKYFLSGNIFKKGWVEYFNDRLKELKGERK